MHQQREKQKSFSLRAQADSTGSPQAVRPISPLKTNLLVLLILALAIGPFSFGFKSGLPRVELGAQRALAANPNVRIFLTGTASTTWTVPSDWNNASNTIEVIGGGGGGRSGTNGAAGGGGGAYAKVSNLSLTPGGSVNIQVGTGSVAEANGTDTWLRISGTTTTCDAAASVCAKAGSTGANDTTEGLGGASSTSIGDITYKGGDGGDSTTADPGGGGGGAAGPNTTSTNGGFGHGANGGLGDDDSTDGPGGGGGGAGGGSAGEAGTVSETVGAKGGNNYLGAGGGARTTGGGACNVGTVGGGGSGGDDALSGCDGGAGTDWDSTHGSGGGGGGAGDPDGTGDVGGNGGLYGAGGGGGGAGGSGAQGIIVITYAPIPSYEQSAYKWYANANSATPGAELTAGVQDASTTLSASGAQFRLRMLMHVSNATATAAQDNFKLQFASTTPGNCLPGTYGSLGFVDVTSSTAEMRFNDNAGVADGSVVVTTSTDPTHGGDSRVNQTYVDVLQANFTVTSTVSAGADGKWDLSLIDNSAPAGTTYCFRVVKSNGTTITTSTSSKIPEIRTTAAANTAPTVSSVVLNAGSAITLTPNATTAINLTAVVSDTDGCSDITSGTTTAMIYRSGVTSSTCQSGADNQFCYIATAFTASSTCSGGSINTTTTFGVYYFAQPTDASSSYAAQNWKGTVIFKDPANATGSADSAGVELQTLLALQVTTSSINYGTINASSTTSSTNQFATTTNVGNTTTTYKIRAQSTLTKAPDSIATSNQRWAVSAFNMDDLVAGTSTALSDSFVLVSDHIMSAATSTAGVAGLRTFWGLRVPASAPTGTYSGVTEFASVYSTADQWWNASWLNRRKITFTNASSSENLTDFPVLALLNSSRIDYAKTLNSGQDIRFVDKDGVTELRYEIELWDEAATSSVWVKVPRIDASSNSDYVWMYYNNTGASDNSSSSAVWDSNFKLVSHFGSLNANATDSTSNLNHGTVTGATATTTNVIAGYAKEFDGANDNLNFGTSTSISDLGSTGGKTLTISLWITFDTFSTTQAYFSKDKVGLGQVGANSGTGAMIYRHQWSGAANLGWTTSNTFLTGTRYYLAITYDANTTSSDALIYMNGTNEATTESNGPPSGSPSSDSAYALRVGENASGTSDFDGRVDEFRYSSVVRSSSWIVADYKNGTDKYNTFGGEESAP